MKKLFIGAHGGAQYATIQAAREEVRRLIAEGLDDDIVVTLSEGTYRLDETLVFTPQDAFQNGHTVTYRAAEGEQVIISGSQAIRGWERADEEIPGLPEHIRGRVWSAPLPERDGKPLLIKTLYDGYRRLPRARGASFCPSDDVDPALRSAAEMGTSAVKFDTMEYPQGAMGHFDNPEDAELVIRPTHAWVMNILPLASVDKNRRIARTKVPATYPMNKLSYRHPFRISPETAWVENIAEGLDEEEKWFASSRTGRLYYVPLNGTPGDSLCAPVLTELIRIEGDEETAGIVRNLIFQGLTFVHGERITWDEGTIGLQHDWDLYDSPNALVRLRGAESCVIRNCLFSASGGGAVRLDLHCMENRIEGNTIKRMGGTGILLSGYGPGTKDVNRNNVVEGNHIHNCAELYWMNPGIFVWQSGSNRIAHNLIHDMPYAAIVVSGPRFHFLLKDLGQREQYGAVRWEEIGDSIRQTHEELARDPQIDRETLAYLMTEKAEPFLHARGNVVEANEIYRVVQVLADGDAIYFSSTGRDNVIRGNYVHDVVTYGTMSHIIRMDGMQYWTRIEKNVVQRCSGGICLRTQCDAINNFLIDLIYPLDSFSARRRHSPWVAITGAQVPHPKRKIRRIERNVYYQSDYIDEFVSFRSTQDYEGNWEDIVIDSNLFHSPLEGPTLARRFDDFRQARGWENRGRCSDPCFLDVNRGDFRFRPESPLPRMGIEPIDLREVGLPFL